MDRAVQLLSRAMPFADQRHLWRGGGGGGWGAGRLLSGGVWCLVSECLEPIPLDAPDTAAPARLGWTSPHRGGRSVHRVALVSPSVPPPPVPRVPAAWAGGGGGGGAKFVYRKWPNQIPIANFVVSNDDPFGLGRGGGIVVLSVRLECLSLTIATTCSVGSAVLQALEAPPIEAGGRGRALRRV